MFAIKAIETLLLLLETAQDATIEKELISTFRELVTDIHDVLSQAQQTE